MPGWQMAGEQSPHEILKGHAPHPKHSSECKGPQGKELCIGKIFFQSKPKTVDLKEKGSLLVKLKFCFGGLSKTEQGPQT